MGNETKPPKANKQRTIQSVEVGFRLITCLIDTKSAISLKDLSTCAGMSPSKAHLYLNSFRNIGLVTQDKRGHYKLGAYALHLGVTALARLDVIEEAREEMQSLRDETGESVILAVWSGRGPCIVAKEEGGRESPLAFQIGYLLPLLRSATGRIFLAYLPSAVTEPEIQRSVAEMRELGLPDTDPDDIAAEVRKRGLARTESQLNIGFSGFSAPIFGHDGAIRAAISIVGLSGAVGKSYSGPYPKLLAATAERISVKLGHRAGAEIG
jgi:DNA-binding IclR family transcriptional regulator